MDMDQAAVFLAGSILTMLGFVVVVAGAVIINNIIHKFWKPVRIFTSDSWNINPSNSRFISQGELDRITPKLDEEKLTKDTDKK
jgi:ascorbate-specific PTS system EIIC-type component UlaA